jgi:DNA-binding transcriptional regulator YhcF (GntR family)
MKISANDSKKIDDILKQQIIDHLLENPIDRGTPGCYSDVAQQFKVLPEQIRRIYRTLREQGLVEGESIPSSTAERSFKENVRTGDADVSVITRKRIKTLADLMEACEVDQNEWNVISWECNKWEVGRKDKSLNWHVENGKVIKGDAEDSGKIFVEPLFQVKAKLARRTVITDLGKQKELLLAELKEYAPKSGCRVCTDELNLDRNQLLEICIFDPHFGKLAWREETDEDYDLKIAEKRVKEAVRELLKRVNLAYISKILLPIGNDLVNIDNRQNTTFAGTPQDTDVRYMKIIRAVKRILIEIIDELSQIADVDVVIVPGNHDTTTSFMIGEVLDAFYHKNELVKIDNTPKLRKYYQFGKNGFQLTHGNEEKHESLGLIFATEQPKLWCDTKFRFCQIGHFHKNKKLWFTSVDEHQGFQIQTLPSLSGTDFWHKSKGYMSLKQAKAMQYDPVHGLVGEFTTTVA